MIGILRAFFNLGGTLLSVHGRVPESDALQTTDYCALHTERVTTVLPTSFYQQGI